MWVYKYFVFKLSESEPSNIAYMVFGYQMVVSATF